MSRVSFQVNAQSLRTVKKNMRVAIRGVAACTKESIVDFCELVLLDATQLVPIDTGALAQSADFKVTGNRRDGYKATVGYGIGRRNPVNRRTGQRASEYAAAVHERLQGTYNGQPKFFEQALYQHASDLETFTGKSISKYLSSAVVGEKEEPDNTNANYESQRNGALQARMNQGFTADVDGKVLPFPVPHGMIYMKGGRYFLNREFYKKSDNKYGAKGKTTKKTAYSIRSKEIHRYTREKAPIKKRSKRTLKTRTSAKSQVTKKPVKQRKATAKTKSSRSSANQKTPKKQMQRRKFISDLAHETALDEFMQYMIDEAAEKRKKKKKEKEEKKRWS